MPEKKKRRRRRMAPDATEIQMTPMIDVVFQLLIYFIVTIKPMDISAHLDVFRPAADRRPKETFEPPKMIQIQILPDTLIMNGRSVSIDRLTDILRRLGAISTSQTVMIMCSRDSKHEQLIDVLDRCAKAGLNSLSVVSMN